VSTCSQDPFDKQRIATLDTVKASGKTWIAAYARGGSAPGQAAKRMYVAVDAVLGHTTTNGIAPLPKVRASCNLDLVALVAQSCIHTCIARSICIVLL
jgi:Photosystem II Pbs27